MTRRDQGRQQSFAAPWPARPHKRNLSRFRGHEIKSTGYGILATFDGPARGARCACAVGDEIRQLGIEIRAGLHIGESEVMGE
jgi:class 3 adenylate cyclase